MRIGIASQVSIGDFIEYLDPGQFMPSGLGTTNVNLLVRALLDRGEEVVIYTLDTGIEKPVTLRGEKLTIHVGRYRNRFRQRDFFRYESKQIKQLILNDPADLVHAHWTYEYAMGALWSKLPCVITVRDWAPLVLRTIPTNYRLVRLFMNNWVFSRTKNFISNSFYMHEMIKNKYGYGTPVIPNPMNLELYNGSIDLGQNNDTPTIVSINNGFDKRKNVHRLFEAFFEIKKSILDARLVLIGGGYEKDGSAATWARSNGLISDDIEFIGPLGYGAAMKVLSQATVMIHPSIEESFGNTLVEAMCLGVPVIAGEKSGAVPWVLNFGDAGLLVDINNAESIARSATAILNDKSTREHYSKAGRSHVFETFHPDRVVKDHVEVYQRTLGLKR